MESKRAMSRIYISILILTLGLYLQSCGVYGFRGKNPPEGIRSVFIPTFEDVSGFSEATLKDRMTQRLKDKVLSDGTFILAEQTQANGLVRCTITSVKDDALVISENEDVRKRKLTVSVNVYFENLKTNKKIWEKQLENFGEYESSSGSFSARDAGITQVIEKISEDIIIELTSNW